MTSLLPHWLTPSFARPYEPIPLSDDPFSPRLSIDSDSHEFKPSESSSSSHRDRTRSRRGVALAGAVLLILLLALGAAAVLTGRRQGLGGAGPPLVPLAELVKADELRLGGLEWLEEAEGGLRTREYWWDVEEVRAAPDGVEKRMLLVNRQYPGPLIEVNEGDRVMVHVTNKLEKGTAIHWHGLYQNGTNYYDGTTGITQCPIPPGETFTYDFNVTGQFGTTWWHSHFSTQYTDGLVGPLVIHSPRERNYVPTYNVEQVVLLSDHYHTFSTELLQLYLATDPANQGVLAGIKGNNQVAAEPTPDSVTINGVGQSAGGGGGYAEVVVEPGQRVRLRLVNAGSFTAIKFSVDHHPLTVIELDGVNVEPYTVSSVTLAVAQRASVILEADQPDGLYWIRAIVDRAMLQYTTPTLESIDFRALGILRYSIIAPSPSLLPQSLSNLTHPSLSPTDLLTPLPALDAPNPTKSLVVHTEFQYTAEHEFLGFFGELWPERGVGMSYEELRGGRTTLGTYKGEGKVDREGLQENGQLVFEFEDVEVVDLAVDNLDDGDHPFHLHGHTFWIVNQGHGRYMRGRSVLNATNPMRRDTVVIPAFSHVVLRFRTDNPGLWAFHCHVQWHMMKGLLMQIASRPALTKSWTFPQDWTYQCTAAAASEESALRRRNGAR